MVAVRASSSEPATNRHHPGNSIPGATYVAVPDLLAGKELVVRVERLIEGKDTTEATVGELAKLEVESTSPTSRCRIHAGLHYEALDPIK